MLAMKMKPEIFLDEFERTEWGDEVFGVVGRGLTFATRFERNYWALASIETMTHVGY